MAMTKEAQSQSQVEMQMQRQYHDFQKNLLRLIKDASLFA